MERWRKEGEKQGYFFFPDLFVGFGFWGVFLNVFLFGNWIINIVMHGGPFINL